MATHPTCGFQKLPKELILLILNYVNDKSLSALRLSSRDLCRALNAEFAHRHFETLVVGFSKKSLIKFTTITSNAEFASSVKTVGITATLLTPVTQAQIDAARARPEDVDLSREMARMSHPLVAELKHHEEQLQAQCQLDTSGGWQSTVSRGFENLRRYQTDPVSIHIGPILRGKGDCGPKVSDPLWQVYEIHHCELNISAAMSTCINALFASELRFKTFGICISAYPSYGESGVNSIDLTPISPHVMRTIASRIRDLRFEIARSIGCPLWDSAEVLRESVVGFLKLVGSLECLSVRHLGEVHECSK